MSLYARLQSCIVLIGFTAISIAAPLQYGGKIYKTVQIGTQTWMAENLDYDAKDSKCYGKDGYDVAGFDYDKEDRPAIKEALSYSKVQENCVKYGRLYEWETAMKICPKGWHLPTNKEWDKLFRLVDGDTGSVSPYQSSTAGKHLKEVSGWNSYKGGFEGHMFDQYGNIIKLNGNGTDDYGFSALPGGRGVLDSSGSDFLYFDVGYSGYWWSATKLNASEVYVRYMRHSGYATWGYSKKKALFSVRCLKD
ncbi:MAG: hypothetical protein LBQ87_03655 [Candidatus Fibromonas sp.]|jgi:uncharacterized protein (TIGR02145 family)|nr:hypothetical protein [Candidatus Fibromonas sp.]